MNYIHCPIKTNDETIKLSPPALKRPVLTYGRRAKRVLNSRLQLLDLQNTYLFALLSSLVAYIFVKAHF